MAEQRRVVQLACRMYVCVLPVVPNVGFRAVDRSGTRSGRLLIVPFLLVINGLLINAGVVTAGAGDVLPSCLFYLGLTPRRLGRKSLLAK